MESNEPFSWDPSSWDWLNNGSNSAGASPHMECDHPWVAINFLEGVDEPEKIALGCSVCGEVWEESSIDLLATIWQASKQEFFNAQRKINALEKVIAENLNVAPCATCGKWLKKDSAFDFGEGYSCFNHIGSSIPDPTKNALGLKKVIEFIKSSGFFPTTDLFKRAFYEKLVADNHALSSSIEEDFNPDMHEIDLSDVTVNLGLRPKSNLSLIVASVARKCDFSIPGSREGKAYVLNLYALANKIKSGLVSLEALDMELEKILPSKEEARVGVAVQICFPDVGEEVQFSGAMAEEALLLTSKRSITTLAK